MWKRLTSYCQLYYPILPHCFALSTSVNSLPQTHGLLTICPKHIACSQFAPNIAPVDSACWQLAPNTWPVDNLPQHRACWHFAPNTGPVDNLPFAVQSYANSPAPAADNHITAMLRLVCSSVIKGKKIMSSVCRCHEVTVYFLMVSFTKVWHLQWSVHAMRMLLLWSLFTCNISLLEIDTYSLLLYLRDLSTAYTCAFNITLPKKSHRLRCMYFHNLRDLNAWETCTFIIREILLLEKLVLS